MPANKTLRVLTAVLWLIGALPAAYGAPPGTGVECAACHRLEAASQPATLMARALEVSGANTILATHSKLIFRRSRFTYTVTTRGAHSNYSVTDGTRTLSLPIRWGMGAGAQTWILSMDGKFYESLVSYFPSLNGLGITIGDDVQTPHTLVEAMGRELGQQDVKACFGCHTTGAVIDGELNLTRFKPGVTCAHCHTGSDAHMGDAVRHNFSSIPPSLGALSTEDISNFCGQCHRSWSSVVLHRWFGEINVRFSPYRLALSKCYDGADPRIGCVTCHNPHLNLTSSPAYYDAKCLACHRPSKQTNSGETQSGAGLEGHAMKKSCPVAKSNCVTCHMPKVKRADDHLTFTDHFIRIVKDDAPYPD